VSRIPILAALWLGVAFMAMAIVIRGDDDMW